MPDPDSTAILIVDDLPEKLLVYRSILEELGQTLVTAGSGDEALRHVLRAEFAVILLDVNMPGMDGFETATLIRNRKRSAHTPIIFLTAFADDVRAAEGYAAGAVDYIPTPVVPEVLRAKVRVFVDLYRMTQQVRRLAEERAKRAAAEDATRRSAFLSEVSRALADSLHPDTIADALARHTVPFLADLSGVILAPDGTGQGWRVDLAWADGPDEKVLACPLSCSDWPKDVLRDAVDDALAHGRSTRLPDLNLPYPAPAARPAPAGSRVRSAEVTPLLARGRTLGVLILAFGPSGRRHGPDDLTLAEDVSIRAATALDNARLYQEVERADRQKNEFLSMLAHELRNPLAPIRNAAQIVRAAAPDNPRLILARDVIDRQVAHMVRLIDDLLDVSRITSGKIQLKAERVDLRAVVGQAVEASRPVIDAAKHALDVALPPDPVWLLGDPARLAQVVTNLLNNAAKYTDPGGRIGLTVSRGEAEAVVRVRDTGVGIPAEVLPTVFDLFVQVDRTLDRSQGGLGIGLTLVRRLVELHAGTASAASDGPGRGSEFTVRLPLRDAGRGTRNDDPKPAGGSAVSGLNSELRTPHSAMKRVLLVEDNPDGAETLSTLLRLAGHEVRVASDGPAAVAAAAEYRPDVAVVDIGLPGMDGYEVARRLRADPATRRAVLVAATGYGRDDDRRRAAEAGFDHHMVKPVDPAALARVVAAAPPLAAE
jgi:signal transduction histidine kinase/DNA-binding response OmpR family regulator